MRTKQIKCKRCESKNTYVLVNGTVVCRGCGYKNKKPQLIFNELEQEYEELGNENKEEDKEDKKENDGI
jgi:hypothetical protein